MSRQPSGFATSALLWDREARLAELVDDGTLAFLQGFDGELASANGTEDTSSTVGTADLGT